jgi:hypothetical protein
LVRISLECGRLHGLQIYVVIPLIYFLIEWICLPLPRLLKTITQTLKPWTIKSSSGRRRKGQWQSLHECAGWDDWLGEIVSRSDTSRKSLPLSLNHISYGRWCCCWTPTSFFVLSVSKEWMNMNKDGCGKTRQHRVNNSGNDGPFLAMLGNCCWNKREDSHRPSIMRNFMYQVYYFSSFFYQRLKVLKKLVIDFHLVSTFMIHTVQETALRNEKTWPNKIQTKIFKNIRFPLQRWTILCGKICQESLNFLYTCIVLFSRSYCKSKYQYLFFLPSQHFFGIDPFPHIWMFLSITLSPSPKLTLLPKKHLRTTFLSPANTYTNTFYIACL